MAKLLYQGHGSYRLTMADGRVIYIDPFAGTGYDLPADLILITHEHYDHTRLNLVPVKPDTLVVRESDMMQNGKYLEKEWDGFKVRAVPAYNENHDRDACVGYVMTLDGVTVYGSGDTSKTDYMVDVLSKEDIDYALFCMDGVYNMGAEEASECARIVGARHSIPVHMLPADCGKIFDRKVAETFKAEGRLILEPGEEIELIHED